MIVTIYEIGSLIESNSSETKHLVFSNTLSTLSFPVKPNITPNMKF